MTDTSTGPPVLLAFAMPHQNNHKISHGGFKSHCHPNQLHKLTRLKRLLNFTRLGQEITGSHFQTALTSEGCMGLVLILSTTSEDSQQTAQQLLMSNSIQGTGDGFECCQSTDRLRIHETTSYLTTAK